MSRAAFRADRGYGTVEYLAAVALSFLVLATVANVVAVQYGRGVLRAAVDEAVRDAARYRGADTPAAVLRRCEHRAAEVMDNLLAGRAAERLTVRCDLTSARVHATVEGSFEGWLPGIPDFDAKTKAFATREGVVG